MKPGDTLGTYQVLAKLGEGGMGEVYRARDSKLNRDVAIKILPDVFAHDRDRIARFTREAQTLAALNHPNIAQIYGVLEEDQPAHVHALVMELVEGDDLSVLIARHAGSSPSSASGWSPGASAPGIPLPEALPIAKQIADALEAAHEQGIVHRDLKPSNIKVRPDGTVKVLDFGLAKALDADASGASSATADAMNSPTLAVHATQMGLIIGTAAYMAPEQARGKAVDKRADIWAFGVVLYEMLTGRRAFTGDDVSVTLASVLKDDVAWAALPADLPASLRRLLRRCLEKDPKRRLSAIGDARLELDEPDAPVSPSASPATASMPARPRWHRLAWALSTLVALAALVAAAYIVAARGPDAPAGPIFVALPVEPADVLGGEVSFSPDGREMVFVGRTGTTSQLFRRSLSQPGASVIPGTEGAGSDGAAFSPDGKRLAFRANRRLKTISLDGGPATELATVRGSRPAWGPDDTIIANVVGNGGLSSVPAAGGPPKTLTKLDTAAGDIEHIDPIVLPEGRALLYLVNNSVAGDAEPMLVAQTFAGGARKPLFRASLVRWLPSGELLFLRGATAMRVGFDARTLTVLGEAVPVRDRGLASGGTLLLEPSPAGALAYVSDDAPSVARGLLPVNRLVKVIEGGATAPIELPERTFSDPRVSPDGTRIAVHGFSKGFDNWVGDLRRGTLMRLTFDAGEDETPVWSPDGRTIAYTSTREGLERAIYRKPADGSGTEELLWSGKGHLHLGGFTPDARAIVLSFRTGASNDIGSLSLETGKLTPLLAAPYGEYDPTLSKDGRWLAYTSDESGRPEVYVRSFPTLEGRWQISIDGGTEPVWARDGRRLFYRGGGKIMAVNVAPGPGFVPSSPKPFADDRFAAAQGDTHTSYDALPDGSLLMVQDTVERRAIRYVSLVLNWLQAPPARAEDGR